jgi:predicted metal-dependent phosphoesterase TrpH
MAGLIDLHTHSCASDGSCTPTELIDEALEKGLSAIALTDHDTVSGLQEFLEYADEKSDFTAVPGVEISVLNNDKEIHIVGLFIDYKCESLEKLLSEVRENRDKRNLEIIRKLNSLDYDITIEEVTDLAGGESIGRPHFAQILISKGYFETPQEVFDKCLKRGATAYCQRILPSPEDAIREIHNAGGLAIWAHPVYRGRNERSYVRKTLKTLMEMGLDGVEAYYSTFTPYQSRMLLEMAEEFNLLVSGGSDYHGINQPTISLGTGVDNLKVPENILIQLKDAK